MPARTKTRTSCWQLFEPLRASNVAPVDAIDRGRSGPRRHARRARAGELRPVFPDARRVTIGSTWHRRGAPSRRSPEAERARRSGWYAEHMQRHDAHPGPGGRLASSRGVTRVEFEIGIGKTARRAYGFDEVAIVPSRRTRDPDDVDISWEVDAYRFPLPMMASAMDAGVSPETAVADRAARRARVPEPRGAVDPVRGPRADLRRDRRPRRRQGDPPDAGALQGAGEAGAARDRRIEEIKAGGRRLVRVAHPAAGGAVRPARAGGRARHPGRSRGPSSRPSTSPRRPSRST